jgi:7-cyano-7-deazaguanine synthase
MTKSDVVSEISHTTALVLFSGGQDSTTCLAWALDRYARVETVGFDYGQRNRIELLCRQHVRDALTQSFPSWRAKLGADRVLELAALGHLSDTALTRDAPIAKSANGLPNTFVPGRNLLFITFAAALAYARGIGTIVGGMCETDFSGYPDCRADTLQSLRQTLNLGMARDFAIEAPLMRLDKAATWRLAEQLGGSRLIEIIVEASHTCYLGVRGERHAWGYGCGTCPACELRRTGYLRYQMNSCTNQ